MVHGTIPLLPFTGQTVEDVFIIKCFFLANDLFSTFKDTDHGIFRAQSLPFIRVHFKFAQRHLAVQLLGLQEFFGKNFMERGGIKYLALVVDERQVVENR